MLRLVRRLLIQLLSAAEEPPDTPLPDDPSAVLLVLLGSTDLLGLILNHAGENSAPCLACVCRTGRRAVAAKRREWLHQLPMSSSSAQFIDPPWCWNDATRPPPSDAMMYVAGVRAGVVAVVEQLSRRVGIHHLDALTGTNAPPRYVPWDFACPYEVACFDECLYIVDVVSESAWSCASVVVKYSIRQHRVVATSNDEAEYAGSFKGFGVAIAPPCECDRRTLCFASNREAGTIHVYDAADLSLLHTIGEGDGGALGRMDDPCGLTFDDGKLYVCDRSNARLLLFSRDGVCLRAIGGRGTEGLYYSHPGKRAMANGRSSGRGRGGEKARGGWAKGSPAGSFLGPCGVCVAHGCVFVIDSMGVRSKTLQVLSQQYESSRLYLRLPKDSQGSSLRNIGVGVTEEGLYVSGKVEVMCTDEGTLRMARLTSPTKPVTVRC